MGLSCKCLSLMTRLGQDHLKFIFKYEKSSLNFPTKLDNENYNLEKIKNSSRSRIPPRSKFAHSIHHVSSFFLFLTLTNKWRHWTKTVICQHKYCYYAYQSKLFINYFCIFQSVLEDFLWCTHKMLIGSYDSVIS